MGEVRVEQRVCEEYNFEKGVGGLRRGWKECGTETKFPT